MAESVRRPGAVATAIDYRVVSPVFDHQGLVAKSVESGAGREVSIRDLSGRVTAKGRVEVEESRK
ncbi:hypothetical protein Aple_037450 [Acrocarpospora pleiomorpha]|uniref:Thioesterase domain-containing protein n=1 Tax=Acrocarpospora pleiomorpha TaxID=90975 RepID=A0A5M3XL01_9ACTN|nr:hypothetical protein [Acrocarpospora pleiomorpha]GES20849.1 hypothetical protein Aple_037450 [Acrocarpospora pleiomorpha]